MRVIITVTYTEALSSRNTDLLHHGLLRLEGLPRDYHGTNGQSNV